MVESVFEATVRKNSGMIKAGRIVSKSLYPYVGKKLRFTVKERRRGDEKNELEQIRKR